MKPFDYNKYLKNNRLLKEMDESNMEEARGGAPLIVPADDAYDLEEEAVYFQQMLQDAGVMARVEAGIGELEIYLTNPMDKRKAAKVIANAGYSLSEGEKKMEEAKPLKPFPKSKWGKPSADTWFSDVQYFIDTHKSEKLKPTDVIGIGDEEMTYADALKKYAGKMREGDMQEGQRPWDFLVYDMDPYLAGKLKGAAKKLGISLKIDEYNPAEWEVRIHPNNEKTFKMVFKMLEKTGLDFEESHGMFSKGMKEGNMEAAGSGIETQLMAMLKGELDDMSFLDGVTDQEFMAALKNMGIKYKTFDNDGEMNYYIGKAGNGMLFVNQDGDWLADDWARP